MEQGFKNKIVLVTGAGSGIGADIAYQFALNNAHVMIIGRQENTLKETANRHENIDYYVADLWNTKNITDVINKIKEQYGRLDILVNNAGWAPVTPLMDLEMAEVEAAFKTNVFGLIDITRQALPMIIENKGNIINISSTVGNYPLPNMSVYSASKAAVSALTRSWAKELANKEVRVNSVIVGPIETPIYNKTDLDEEAANKHKEFVLSTVPLQRFGEVHDISNMVLFLASDKAKFITGSGMSVDGGVLA